MQSEYERKLAAAFHELETAGIPRHKSDPRFYRILRYFGMQIRPLHYINIFLVPFVEMILSFVDLTIILAATNTLITILFDWPYQPEFMVVWIANLSNLFDGIFIPVIVICACFMGLIEFSNQMKTRRKHLLSRWEDL